MFSQNFKRFFSRKLKETGLYGCVYDFSVDYGNISINYILDIRKYLMKKRNIN